jgi:hypothetical protein
MAGMVTEFSLRDKLIGVLVTWGPKERFRGQTTLRMFDGDNRTVATSKSRKIDFRKGAYARSTWEIPMLDAPGSYRVEILVDDKTYWRGVVRINP